MAIKYCIGIAKFQGTYVVYMYLVICITDNGTNIVAAFEIKQWKRMPCFIHTLQLAVEVVLKLPEVSHALARCRHLVAHFNRSAKSTYLLKKKTD